MAVANDGEAGRPTVFISYARTDRPRVAPLAEALKAAGLEVWWDALIESGAAFATTIEGALDAADAVIVIWSATSVASDWVRDEAAKGRDLRKLVPVSLDGTSAPMGFRQYHVLDVTAWNGASDAPEIAAVLRGVAGVAGQVPIMPAPQVKRPASRRAVVLGGTGAAILLGGGGLFLARQQGWIAGGAKRTTNSVAVLPFANLSGDSSQAYFSDGLSEELRSALSRNPQLQVAAPTSSGKFRDGRDDAKTIASKLRVAFLLEGSVRRSGDVVRVAAQLIEAATGFSAWSQTFDRKMDDIFAVQSEIANTVADALGARVAGSGDVADASSAGGTKNTAAYDSYLRGRGYFDLAGDETTYRSALAQFDAAIAADPSYAAAHAARSRTLAAIANQFAKGEQLRGLYESATAAAKRATKLDENLADAHSALGFALYNGQLDMKAARQPYERSRTLGAGNADVLIRYATFCARTGRAEAAQEAIDRAARLDPLNPRVYRTQAAVLYAARRYAESIPPGEKALALNPKMGVAHAAIGDALLLLGRTQEARDAYAKETNALFRLPGIAIAERKLGDIPASQAAMAQLVADHGDNGLYQQAQVLSQWGEREAALAALAKARAVGDSGLTYLRNDPMVDGLRSDARFSRLLGNLGFE